MAEYLVLRVADGGQIGPVNHAQLVQFVPLMWII
jgi:hypothetical protein